MWTTALRVIAAANRLCSDLRNPVGNDPSFTMCMNTQRQRRPHMQRQCQWSNTSRRRQPYRAWQQFNRVHCANTCVHCACACCNRDTCSRGRVQRDSAYQVILGRVRSGQWYIAPASVVWYVASAPAGCAVPAPSAVSCVAPAPRVYAVPRQWGVQRASACRVSRGGQFRPCTLRLRLRHYLSRSTLCQRQLFPV